MELSTENIIDLIMAAFFLCMIARGWFMGLAFQAARLAALAGAGIISFIMANVVGIPLLSGLFFFITFVLFLQVVKVVKIVDQIPLIGTLDKAGGALAGFFFAFLACYFLFHFLSMAVPQEVWNQWGLTRASVGKSYLLQAFLR